MSSPGQTQPRRPRADAERNRARLLDAARAAFASGREPVTLEQIARDSGVGIGTLYRHFPTREALVEALYRKELADLCASVGRPAGDPPAGPGAARVDGPVRRLRRGQARDGGHAPGRLRRGHGDRVPRPGGTSRRGSAILEADAVTRTLRDDVRPEDIVALIVGSFTATSLAGGREQLERMFDLLMDAGPTPGRAAADR